MTTLFDTVVYGLPWWVQTAALLLPAAAVALLVARLFGVRAALQAAGGLLAAIALIASRQQARQQGWKERGERDVQAARKRADERETIRDDVRSSSDADLDRRLSRWVRD